MATAVFGACAPAAPGRPRHRRGRRGRTTVLCHELARHAESPAAVQRDICRYRYRIPHRRRGRLALGWTGFYLIGCAWPYRACRRCHGAGKLRSPSGKAWRRCPCCKASGTRIRTGVASSRACGASGDRRRTARACPGSGAVTVTTGSRTGTTDNPVALRCGPSHRGKRVSNELRARREDRRDSDR